MNDNEATSASASNQRSRKLKVTYERVVIECEDNCGVFYGDHANEPEDRGGFGPAGQVDADLIAPVSGVEECNGGERWPDYWLLPGIDCLVKICASPEGLGELEPSDTTSAYAVARALHMLRMLLQRMQHAGNEPITLEAVDIASAA